MWLLYFTAGSGALLFGLRASAVLDLLADSPELVHEYRVIILQVGVMDVFDLQDATAEVWLGAGRPFQDIIDLIHMVNPPCIVLVAALLPRGSFAGLPWDTVRQQLNYYVLQQFNDKAALRFFVSAES